MAKKKHHYIPKFYLDGFVDLDGFIWIYDKDMEKMFRQKSEAAAYEKDYFSFINLEGGKDSETIENFIASLESISAETIKKILASRSIDELNVVDKSKFALFVALMMVRIPNYRRNIESGFAEISKRVLMFSAANKQFFESTLRRIEEERGKKIDIPIEELRQTALNPDKHYIFETNPTVSLEMALDHLKELHSLFYNMKWAFLKAGNDYKFLAGDNPLYYFDPTHDHNSFYGVGLANDNIEVTLSLSKDICAFGSWKHREGYMQVNNQLIKHINRRTVIAARRYVFASTDSEVLKNFVIKYKNSAPRLKVG
jgi:hypothetical protein